MNILVPDTIPQHSEYSIYSRKISFVLSNSQLDQSTLGNSIRLENTANESNSIDLSMTMYLLEKDADEYGTPFSSVHFSFQGLHLLENKCMHRRKCTTLQYSSSTSECLIETGVDWSMYMYVSMLETIAHFLFNINEYLQLFNRTKSCEIPHALHDFSFAQYFFSENPQI